MLKIIKDKDPIWETDNFDVVLVGTSIFNKLNGSFQGKLKNKYPIVEETNRRMSYGDLRRLGTRVTVNEKPQISLMYICGYPRGKHTVLDYEALTHCLKTANAEFKGKNALMTVTGSSVFDGSGDKERCLEIIKDNTLDLNVTVYDYQQKKIVDEIAEQKKYLTSLKLTNKEKYEQLAPIFDLYLKKIYLNG